MVIFLRTQNVVNVLILRGAHNREKKRHNIYTRRCPKSFFLLFIYLQHAPLQIVILHAWKDHRTRFTLYTFPSYFMLIPMSYLFFLIYSRV
jgi:hypothetical protein